MKYVFIKANRSAFSIKKMCRVLEVSKSGYYKYQIKPESQRDKDNNMLLNRIQDIYKDNKGRYGSPRIKKQLSKEQIVCSKNRVARLMSKNNIKAKTRRKFRFTTDSNHNHAVAENVLKQEFTATELNQKWVSDITYIYTQEGWLYLAVILDLCSRKVVGWSMGDRITPFSPYKLEIIRPVWSGGHCALSSLTIFYAFLHIKKVKNPASVHHCSCAGYDATGSNLLQNTLRAR